MLGEPAALGDDVGGAARDERSTEHRDGAEGAAAVAAGGDLEGRPRPTVEAGPDDARAGGRGGHDAVDRASTVPAGAAYGCVSP